MFVGALAYDALAETVLLVLISASALVSAGAALVDTNIKRVIAFSTISQLAFVFLGFVAGNGVGVSGALLFILVHGISKAGLFLGAGVVEHATHTKDIEAMGGLGRTMPVTAASFFVCALSVMGLPPFGGFFGKLMVITGAVQAGHKLVAAVFVVGAVLTVLYLLRLFNRVFLGEPRGQVAPEGDRWMVGSVAALAVASVLSGLFINWPSLVAEVAAQRMLSGVSAPAPEALTPRSALDRHGLGGQQ
jgi:formate hydrogenlyase subunit 3/multisubunit Na+/H+ antiporter MnhD subunit